MGLQCPACSEKRIPLLEPLINGGINMPVLNKKNLQIRKVFTSEFAKSYPRSFRQLQDMTLAAVKAQRNSGKRSIFGKDKGAEAFNKFMHVATKLCETLVQEGATRTGPDESNELEKINFIIQSFFFAYPNWKDAEPVWGGFYLGVTDLTKSGQ